MNTMCLLGDDINVCLAVYTGQKSLEKPFWSKDIQRQFETTRRPSGAHIWSTGQRFVHFGLSIFGEAPEHIPIWDAEGVGKQKSDTGSLLLSLLTNVRAGQAHCN